MIPVIQNYPLEFSFPLVLLTLPGEVYFRPEVVLEFINGNGIESAWAMPQLEGRPVQGD